MLLYFSWLSNQSFPTLHIPLSYVAGCSWRKDCRLDTIIVLFHKWEVRSLDIDDFNPVTCRVLQTRNDTILLNIKWNRCPSTAFNLKQSIIPIPRKYVPDSHKCSHKHDLNVGNNTKVTFLCIDCTHRCDQHFSMIQTTFASNWRFLIKIFGNARNKVPNQGLKDFGFFQTSSSSASVNWKNSVFFLESLFADHHNLIWWPLIWH